MDLNTRMGVVPAEGTLRAGGRELLLALYTAMRSLKLYPVENAVVQRALDDLEHSAETLLGRESELEMRLSGDFIFVNSTRLRLELDNYASFSSVLASLRRAEVGVIRITRDVRRRDWQAFLSILISLDDRELPEPYEELAERMFQAGVHGLETDHANPIEESADEQERRREVAKRTYSHGVSVAREVVTSVRMGKAASVKKVKRAVQMIVDQVLNNETSLMGLTTIRDYDEYTFQHSVNVCIFAVALGKRLGFAKLQLYDLGMTALMHDIGKARVPAQILNKDGGLDEEEWRIMQAHPWFGALTLFSLRGYDEIPYHSILVAHEHHMKRDLTGYPRHVRQRELGLFSRIVAVADGFDAATTRRSYQTVPIEPDQVLREMWENPRRGYDPVLVKAFINLIGIYPVGTCVILDTFEVAVVTAPNPVTTLLNRPIVRIAIDVDGAFVGAAGAQVDLAEQTDEGRYARSIVKVTSPTRHGIVPGDFFV